MPGKKVLDWLLEDEQPSVRYLALTGLLGRPESDREVKAAQGAIRDRGWAAEILAERNSAGGWGPDPNSYRPKYVTTHWKMLVLSDLGLTKAEPVIRDCCEAWMATFPATGGGLGGASKRTPHYCLAGNMARALIRFGYEDDVRVRRTLEWLVEVADPRGGWSCFGSGRNLDSWEGLSAFSVYPRSKWTPSMTRCVERAAEFFLQRELHQQGASYPPWYRFHYPVHYYYDVLVGLDLLTALGYGSDPRLQFALQLLAEKQRADGRWILDAVHPDVEGAMAVWFQKHPKDRPVPFQVEPPGRPSKMVTLTALKVQGRVRDSRTATSPPDQ
ncbi:MAG: terpene cyclase/mutase family protein [Thermoplasmata archaeon]|nr:terpene cyclase/mutase family protein [Thermoplasmata archaeon]